MSRLSIAARVVCLAAVLGLSFAVPQVTALPIQSAILLIVVGTTAIAAELTSRMPDSYIALAEALLASLVISIGLPDTFILLPYLIVPAFLAGAVAGAWPVVWVISAEVLGVVGLQALHLLSPDGELTFSASLDAAFPWLLTSAGVGSLGAWARQVRYPGGAVDSDASYESARRLLTQLRAVTRRLSAGLDPVSMSDQLLVEVHQTLHDTHSAVFIRTEGGVLAPMSYRGLTAKEALSPEGPVVDACWAEVEPAHAVQNSGEAHRRHRYALPLRVGTRMIGLIVAEGSEAIPPKSMAGLMRQIDDFALRIDTALTFDEVRSLATMEERQRLAREIHDGVAQEIASLGYSVDDLASTSTDPDQREHLQVLRGEITRVVSELRLSIFDLRAEVSPTAGLGSALSDYVRAVGARSEMTVHLTLDEAPTRLRSEVETELLRIAQEAITNARKHSAALNLWVDCRIQPPYASITVRDDGTGMSAGRADSYGLKIMRERAERINAALNIGATDKSGVGTMVTVSVGSPAAN